jgi:hypothetical protein
MLLWPDPRTYILVLWRTNEWCVNFRLPQGSLSDEVESVKTPKPQAQPDMGSNATLNCQVDPSRPRLSYLYSPLKRLGVIT